MARSTVEVHRHWTVKDGAAFPLAQTPQTPMVNHAGPAAPVPPGMTGAVELLDCDINGTVYGIYAPDGGRMISRGSSIRGGIAAIEAGGDARIHLEDTDVMES